MGTVYGTWDSVIVFRFSFEHFFPFVLRMRRGAWHTNFLGVDVCCLLAVHDWLDRARQEDKGRRRKGEEIAATTFVNICDRGQIRE